MLEIIIELNDGRHFVIEAEGKRVDWIASQGAAQTDEHREGLWTLTKGRNVFVPGARVDNVLKHGDHVQLKLIEKHARVTPIGSTHPDDRNPPALPVAPSENEAEGARAIDNTEQRVESITRSAAKTGRTLKTTKARKRRL